MAGRAYYARVSRHGMLKRLGRFLGGYSRLGEQSVTTNTATVASASETSLSSRREAEEGKELLQYSVHVCNKALKTHLLGYFPVEPS